MVVISSYDVKTNFCFRFFEEENNDQISGKNHHANDRSHCDIAGKVRSQVLGISDVLIPHRAKNIHVTIKLLRRCAPERGKPE